MYQFRQIAENKLRLGRPRIVEWIGLLSLAAGLALLGAPLTGEFTDWFPLVRSGVILVAIGVRLCFLYSRISITKLERDILVEGYWFRSAFRVKRKELLEVCSYRNSRAMAHSIELQLVMKSKKAIVVYYSMLQEGTDMDAEAVAAFLEVPWKTDGATKRFKEVLGSAWRGLWPWKKGRKRKS